MTNHAPYDESAEMALLGAVLISPKQIPDLHRIRPHHFYLQDHQRIWAAIWRLDQHGDKVDPITVADELDRRGQTPTQGRAYIHALVSAVPSTTHTQAYADIVHRHSLLRHLRSLSVDIAEMQEADRTVEEILAHISDTLQKLENDAIHDDLIPIAEALADHWEYLKHIQESDSHTVGIPTGFAKLDDIISGLRPGAVVLVAGRPAMGKTTFGLALLEAASALDSTKAQAFFSLEQPDTELNSRLISAFTKIPGMKMTHGELTPEDWQLIEQATEKLSRRKIYIDDTPSLTLTEIRAKLRRLQRREGLSAAFIDYVQLLQPDRFHESREREMADVSRKLKLIAKELEIPVIVMAQLNRQVEARTDKRPLLSDLRESGALEQDADQVLMLYRDEYYHPNSDELGLVEVLVRKNRHGPTGVAKLAFRADCGRFMSIPGKG